MKLTKTTRVTGIAGLTRLSLFAVLALVAGAVQALEFRSVKDTGVAFYDSPSLAGRKLFLVSRYYPVEVLTRQNEWARIRDASGAIAWVQYASLSPTRTVVVTAPEAVIRTSPDVKSSVSFKATRAVALQLLEPPKSGWVKVRHRDGVSGYAPLAALWGL